MSNFIAPSTSLHHGLDEVDCFNRDGFLSILNSEFERLFGHSGLLMVEKVLQHYKSRDEITSDDVRIIIELLVASVEDILSPNAVTELRENLRSRCGLIEE